jgi:hypothetical protein
MYIDGLMSASENHMGFTVIVKPVLRLSQLPPVPPLSLPFAQSPPSLPPLPLLKA